MEIKMLNIDDLEVELARKRGPAFKELMDRVMPDWRDRARKLRE